MSVALIWPLKGIVERRKARQKEALCKQIFSEEGKLLQKLLAYHNLQKRYPGGEWYPSSLVHIKNQVLVKHLALFLDSNGLTPDLTQTKLKLDFWRSIADGQLPEGVSKNIVEIVEIQGLPGEVRQNAQCIVEAVSRYLERGITPDGD